MNNSNELKDILVRIKSESEDIIEVIDHGILVLAKRQGDFEISIDDMEKAIDELFNIKEKLNKDFIQLRKKV